MGSVSGPAFFVTLADVLGEEGALSVQGVTCEATIAGYLAGGDGKGSRNM